ncbi:putative ribonuclease H2 subunit C [Blattamonas nauphoetae]|uniref:Ribonuclease H2 subunit C n=1 Tax=Blattamonas nauphoetae TaxID=2049346 RepID=A0ABQ9XBY7_9EUKA|nr:putative ribonuclease H2 subunit C [Blattamonas nauphoetae]
MKAKIHPSFCPMLRDNPVLPPNVNSPHLLHILPCKIGYTGPCDASNFFYVTQDSDESYHTYFRGRELNGAAVDVPEGYQSSIFATKPNNTVRPTTWSPLPKQDANDSDMKIVAWNHDEGFPPGSQLKNALHWTEVSKILHDIEESEDEWQDRSPPRSKNSTGSPS